jgi:hypothetical protein
MNSGKFRWSVVTALTITVIALLFGGAQRLHQAAIYGAWEAKQVQILKDNRGNGLAPLPESNPDYFRLVKSGSSMGSFLLDRMRDLSKRKYKEEDSYRSSLQRYVAYAVIDIFGWKCDEMEQRSKGYDSLADCVLAHYRDERSSKHGTSHAE